MIDHVPAIGLTVADLVVVAVVRAGEDGPDTLVDLVAKAADRLPEMPASPLA
ncbi:hypothetical protein [Roseovarius sp. D22-M7]|uniref:hypothetical protein n=1 Tax=Roseovarius sp. D22-M7 TaxID=3127116 RepID=UPI00300FA5CA